MWRNRANGYDWEKKPSAATESALASAQSERSHHHGLQLMIVGGKVSEQPTPMYGDSQ
jgi:hypothetical protein